MCHQELPVTSFKKEKRVNDGLTARCKPCMRSVLKEYYKSDRCKVKFEEQQRAQLAAGTVRVCTKCLRSLPLTSFHIEKRTIIGRQAQCKECRDKWFSDYRKTDEGKAKEYLYLHSEHGKIARNRYRDSEKGQAALKKFRESDTWKEYLKSESYKASLAKYAKSDKRKESLKKYNESQKAKDTWKAYKQSERGKEVNKVYRDTDKGKANAARATYRRRALDKLLPSTLTAEEWEQIKKHYKYRCVYCGEEKELTRDHIIPLTKGGAFTKDNVVPACRSCNATKYNKPVLLQLLVEASSAV